MALLCSVAGSVPDWQGSQIQKVVDGREREEGHPDHVNTLPPPGKQMGLDIVGELSAEHYPHMKRKPPPIEKQTV